MSHPWLFCVMEAHIDASGSRRCTGARSCAGGDSGTADAAAAPAAPAKVPPAEPAAKPTSGIVSANLHDAGWDHRQRRASGACRRFREGRRDICRQRSRRRPTQRFVRRQKGGGVEGVGAWSERVRCCTCFLFDPAVTGAEYGLGRILAEAYPGSDEAAGDLEALYRFAGQRRELCSVSRQCNPSPPQFEPKPSGKPERSEVQIHPDVESLHDILDR